MVYTISVVYYSNKIIQNLPREKSQNSNFPSGKQLYIFVIYTIQDFFKGNISLWFSLGEKTTKSYSSTKNKTLKDGKKP